MRRIALANASDEVKDDAKNDIRYWQAGNSIPKVYMPPLLQGGLTWQDVSSDPAITIFITEGEKKAACACLSGFTCLGIGGVWSWQAKKKSISRFQGRWIARLGLATPETLITTDPAEVRKFARRHGEVVYKSASGVRSIVRRLSSAQLEEVDQVASCPTLFQRYIPGDDLRVHIIGNEVHGLAISSNRDDYRYAAMDGGRVQVRDIRLPPRMAQQLLRMTRVMGLMVAGIDLRRTPSGELYCLEVNPSPGFTYFERLAGVDLATSVAALLTKGLK